MRQSRSGLSPGARRSISCSIIGGMIFLRSNARPRKIIIVTDTIEQASSGHMKSPPLEKNPSTLFTTPVSAMIQAAIIGLEK